jgi:hypothetical protein
MKFQGRYTTERTTLHQDFLSQQYALLPVTFDPGGQIGPLFRQFLWSTASAPSTTFSSPTDRTDSPFATFSMESTNKVGFPNMVQICGILFPHLLYSQVSGFYKH